MNRVLRNLSIAAVTLILTSALAWAQATAELNGRVTDESGAVLPGVTVTATQTDTGFTRSVVTDGTGAWVMPNVPTGPYRLEVSLQGFRTYVQTGIVLQVGATPTINAELAVGNLEETVSVEAATPIVDVRSAGISDVVENERIVELPLQGRQVTDLIVLAGAAVQTGVASNRAMTGGVTISVAGGLFVRGCVHARRGDAQRCEQQRQPADAVPGRAPGIQRRDERAERAERHARRGLGQRGDQVGDQQPSRQPVRIRSQQALQCHGSVCRDRSGDRRAQGRRSGPQPVRWDARRADHDRQALLLRRLSGHECHADTGVYHHLRADRRDARW